MLGTSIIDDIKYQFRYGNTVVRIIFVNVAVFLVLALFNLFSFFGQSHTLYNLVLSKLQVPASVNVLLYQPWSVFTYMFLHESFMHILFNMLWLYWFGEIFVLFLGQKKVLPLYILGGLTGALVYILAYNFIPVFTPLVGGSLMLGASASIFAIVFAAATISPDYEIRLLLLGAVRIKYIAVISLLLDVISIPYGNAGGYLAHVGGAICGYLYIKALQSGFDMGAPLERIKNIFKRRSKVKVTHKNVNYRSEPQQAKSSSDQQKLDNILDKISRSGYDSLTKDEKDFLFHFSKK
jgi:membrane associated rhomboid family serine protease